MLAQAADLLGRSLEVNILEHARLLVVAEAGAGRHQVAKDHILLEANEVILLASQRSFGQHLGRLLERRRADERVGLERGLGDAEQERRGRRGLLALLTQELIRFAEAELVDHRTGQELTVTRILDLHLAHHLRQDDLNVLVVNRHALSAVDGLHFAKQVVLHRLLPLNGEHVVRNQRTIDECFPRLDVIAAVHAQVLTLRHQVLTLKTTILALDEDRALAAALVAELNHAIDLGQHRRILRATSFEQFGNPRQTTSDVLGALHFARRLGEHHAGIDLLAVVDFDVGLLRHRRDCQAVATFVFDDEVRVQITLVLNHHLALDLGVRITLDSEGLALENILVAHRAADFGENRIVVRIPGAKRLVFLDLVAFRNVHDSAQRHRVTFEFALLLVDDDDVATALQRDDLLGTLAFCDQDFDRFKVGELHTARALVAHFGVFDLLRCRATDVERTHCQLRARFTDRLRADDANCEARLGQRTARQVHAVALGADTDSRFTGERRTHADRFTTDNDFDLLGDIDRDQFVLPHDDFVRHRVDDRVESDSTANRIDKGHGDLVTLVDGALVDTVLGAAVSDRDDDVLGDVGELASQVTRVRRLERRIGQSLTSTVRRREILQHAKAFEEVGLNRLLDNLARRLGHQTTHAGELTNLLDGTTRLRHDHAVDRVHVETPVAHVVAQLAEHVFADLLAGVRPRVDDLQVTLTLGDDAASVCHVDLLDLTGGLLDDRLLRRWDDHVILAEGQARACRGLEASLLEAVQETQRRVAIEQQVAIGDDVRQRLLVQVVVVVRHPLFEDLVEHDATGSRLDERLAVGNDRVTLVADLNARRELHLDARVDVDLVAGIRHPHFVARREGLAFAEFAGTLQALPVAAEHNILVWRDDRTAVCRREDVVDRQHQRASFDLRFERQRQVHGHLVAIEVGVVGRADERVDADGVAFDQHRLERLDANAVKRRRAVEQHRVVLDDLFEDVPDLLILALQHLLGRLDGVGVAEFLQATDDERLEQLKRDDLRQTTLVQTQIRTNDDDRTCRVVDALAEQVLAEAALLALDHVRQGLERAVA